MLYKYYGCKGSNLPSLHCLYFYGFGLIFHIWLFLISLDRNEFYKSWMPGVKLVFSCNWYHTSACLFVCYGTCYASSTNDVKNIAGKSIECGDIDLSMEQQTLGTCPIYKLGYSSTKHLLFSVMDFHRASQILRTWPSSLASSNHLLRQVPHDSTPEPTWTLVNFCMSFCCVFCDA